MLTRFKTIWKSDKVLVISALLALLSMFLIPPSLEYFSYIDFRVLSLLFCLMLIISSLVRLNIFEILGRTLMTGIHSLRGLFLISTLLCFFLSMFLTNDVALITFIPFSIMLVTMCKMEKYMIPLLVLNTLAANLGSMLTPIGNPQNLFLYTHYSISILEFFSIMLPYAIFALVLLLISILLIKNQPLTIEKKPPLPPLKKKKVVIIFILFSLCIFTVLNLLDYRLVFIVVLLTEFILDRELILKIDYHLLLTFVFFFIFIGNMKQLPFVSSTLSHFVQGNELMISIFSSQFISNVPAAILLSQFTKNYSDILIGCNLGGLGTLIASMASLISYKFYTFTTKPNSGKYLTIFTIFNIIYLILLLGFYFILHTFC